MGIKKIKSSVMNPETINQFIHMFQFLFRVCIIENDSNQK